jgi:hypothetical protein
MTHSCSLRSVPLVLVVVVGALLSSCVAAHELRPNDDGAVMGTPLNYDYPLAPTFEAAKEAAMQLGLAIREVKEGQYFIAEHEMSAFSMGEVVAVYVRAQSPAITTVTVRSERKMATNMFAKDYTAELHQRTREILAQRYPHGVSRADLERAALQAELAAQAAEQGGVGGWGGKKAAAPAYQPAQPAPAPAQPVQAEGSRARVIIAGGAKTEGQAADDGKQRMIAVLEFTNEAALSGFEVEALSDDVRGAALVLPRDRYIVMTRESMMMMLPPGTDLAQCSEGQCEVEAGRKVGADLVAAGRIGKFADELEVRVKLFDTHSAALLGQVSATGKDLKGLRRELVPAVEELFGAIR